MRKFALLASVCLVAHLTPVLVGSSESDKPSSPLAFRIQVEKVPFLSPGSVGIEWELENVSDHPIYVCQWPGPSFTHSWEASDGIREGVRRGYPETRKLSRKYFIELKPAEAIFGWTVYPVPATPTGKLTVGGTYRSGQTGSEFNLEAWLGEADADGVEIDVSKAAPTGAKRRDSK